jgi:adenylate cyclase
MRRTTKRDALAVALISTVSGLLVCLTTLAYVHGLSLDILTTLRWQLFGLRHDPASSHAVVVALDEESYRAPPFSGSPTLTWTAEIGRVLNAVIDGGAKVVGFDIIFPSSIEQSEIPFGGQPLGTRIRGFDRDFLRALATGAAAGKVVLGEVQQREQSVRPAPAQRIAVRQQQNIRALNVFVDDDEVIRRLPLSFLIEGRKVPSMAVELAARALGAEAKFMPDQSMQLAGFRIAGSVPNTLTLNFEGGSKDIPTYSLADLRACVEKGDAAFFRREFAGKVVIFGTLLDLEDRKLTSKRFVTGPEAANAARCAGQQPAALSPLVRPTVAGVYIHATGINNLMRGDPVVEPGRTASVLIAIAFAALAATAAILLTPVGAAISYIAMSAALVLFATMLFLRAFALPVIEPLLAGILAMVAIISYRFVVADKEERFLLASFALYLAPQVIDQMMRSRKLPRLGGEMRSVTVFFSDLAGFSSLAEKMGPDELVMLMNEYLSAMTDIIEECGGYVDKYFGDSIVAIFGAPVDDPDNAGNAVRAALKCRDRLEELNRATPAFQGHLLSHRIGLNSGMALVGNIGSRRRFNYTAMSDAVNLASRLEGANKYFATSIMASETTVELVGSTVVWRELDAIRVQGRIHPVRIYEPMALAGGESAEQAESVAVYAEALTQWRARDFTAAAQSLERIAERDPPAAVLLKRARDFVRNPPGADWDAVNTLEGK